MINTSVSVFVAMRSTLLVCALAFITFSLFNSCQAQETTDINLTYLPTDNSYIDHGSYQVKFDPVHHQPQWIAYELTPQELIINIERGRRSFKDDPLNQYDIHTKLYDKSGYDRGHLVPARDMQYDSLALIKSFYMSNVSPQLAGFNRGIWKRLENQTRRWAEEDDQIYIITGPIFIGSIEQLHETVSIPTYFYKIILDLEPEIKAIAFLFPHEKSNKHIKEYIVSIDSIESFIGLDFFYRLDDETEQRIEAEITEWSFN